MGAIKLCLEEERHIAALGEVFNFVHIIAERYKRPGKTVREERYRSDSQEAKNHPQCSPLNREATAVELGAAERKS